MKVTPLGLFLLFIILALTFLIGRMSNDFVFPNFYSENTSQVSQKIISQDILWEKINQWEQEQGYYAFIQDDNSCLAAMEIVDNLNDDWDNTTIDISTINSTYGFYNSGVSTARNFPDEDSIINAWITSEDTQKNYRTPYTNSCIRCMDNTCVQVMDNQLPKRQQTQQFYTAPIIREEQTTSSTNIVCNCAKTCSQMSSCVEAQYQLNSCGCGQRDGDGDGIACDSMCQ